MLIQIVVVNKLEKSVGPALEEVAFGLCFLRLFRPGTRCSSGPFEFAKMLYQDLVGRLGRISRRGAEVPMRGFQLWAQAQGGVGLSHKNVEVASFEALHQEPHGGGIHRRV